LRRLSEALAYKENIINLYPKFEKALKEKISESNTKTVSDIWSDFKAFYEEVSGNKPATLKEFGIQSELYFGSESSSPTFYFALNYRIECEYEGDEYSFYEMVYCEFDITSLVKEIEVKGELSEFVEGDSSVGEAVEIIEKWWVFNDLKALVLPLRIWSTEL